MNTQDWMKSVIVDDAGEIVPCAENINTMLRRIVALEKQLAEKEPAGGTRLENRHKLYEGFGELHPGGRWSDLLGIPRNTMWRYLKKGLTVEEIAKLRGVKYPTE